MRNISFQTRLFIFVRNLIFPYKILDNYLPNKGKFLDLGCGHGTLASYLAKQKNRHVLGIDPSKAKITNAKSLYSRISNLDFKVGYLEQVRKKFDVITITDVLYLLPKNETQRLLIKARKILPTNGVLILKETLVNNWISLEEHLMTKIGLTHSDFKKTHFKTQKDYLSLLRSSGFKIKKSITFTKLFLYKQILFVCQAQNSSK